LSIPVTVALNTDPGSELQGKPYVGVASTDVFETVDHSIAAAAVNSVTDIFPTAWESSKGVVKVLNPVNVFTHLNGTNDDLSTRPTTLVGVTGLSDDVGDAAGLMGILFLLAVLNVFIGVFNMFPLLPLDGGHAAIATYERVRERGGRRYYADVSKMMPFAMAVMTVLLFLFASGLYLDITDPMG
jgi:membrane-associated protease RseP (regulator of RpoE activity)